ncbi:MAG: hypothetical protein IJG24_06665, partial [Selenomonadaceae bacterium]|nr:hypothetical protein [Selenomonadaceae bacterium]
MINLDYLYNPAVTKDDDLFSIDHFDDKKLTFQIIDKGMILPHKAIVDGKPTADGWGYGGLVDGNGEYIASS